MTSRKAFDSIELSASWLEAVNDWRRKNRLTLAELGERVGQVRGEPAFAHTTISRFLRGEGPSRQVAEAIAEITGIPLPHQKLEEPWARWLQLGQRLNELQADIFQDELYELARLVDALTRRKQRRSP